MKKRTFARGCAMLAVLALGAGTAMASEAGNAPADHKYFFIRHFRFSEYIPVYNNTRI